MVEEKQTTSEEVDDWLTDLDDESDDLSGELDQDNIDALIGGGADAEEASSEDLDGSGELDQDNIDALLGGVGDTAPEEQAETQDDLGELDQENIDALLGEAGDAAPEAQAEASEESSEFDELDQDSIDALLGGDDTPEERAAEESSPEEAVSSDELDQENIDALLGADSIESNELDAVEDDEDDQTNIDALLEKTQRALPAEEVADDLDQSDIDSLLGDDAEAGEDAYEADAEIEEGAEEDSDLDIFLGSGSGDEAAEGDGLEVEQDEIDRLFAGLDDDDDDDLFQAEEIDFAEVIEGDSEDEMDLGVEGVDETIASDKTEVSGGATLIAGSGQQGTEYGEEEEEIVARSGLPFIPDSFNKTTIAALGGTLLLLIAFCLYLFMPEGDEPLPVVTPDGAVQKTEAPPVAEQAVASTNFIPLVNDTVFSMPHTGGEIPVRLSAQDKDDNALTFSLISQPKHGRLSGEAPFFTYLPDATFPGEDHFEFSASDGKDTSSIASVIIRGPNLVERALVEKKSDMPVKGKVLMPARTLVSAKDVIIAAKSTTPVEINWGAIWQEANKTRLTRDTYLEIDSSTLKGNLKKMAFGKYHYTPDPFYEGKEVIGYRFKKGGLSSRDHQVTLEIAMGSPSPEINLKKLYDGYLVGQTVLLDATQSRDEARESLDFKWEQAAGVPVELSTMNEEGSIVSFVMPSTFYTEEKPGLTFILTAVDETGKTDTLHVKVPVISRRQAALWRSENGIIADDPPMSGRMLPWQYRD